MRRTASAAVTAILVGVAPSLAETPTWTCVDNAELTLGSLVLFNNVWNKGTIQDYEQCIAADDRALRWRWRWPGGDLMPEAYPEVVFGHHPWRQDSTTDALPRRLEGVEELTVHYAAELDGEGVYNLAFQSWLVDRVPATPDAARAEVMVWISNHGMKPAGRRVHLIAREAEYDVYESPRRHLDRGAWRTWQLLTLVAREELLAGPLDLGALLNELSAQGLLANGLWIANVDLGTEVAGGSGSAVVSDYRVSVR